MPCGRANEQPTTEGEEPRLRLTGARADQPAHTQNRRTLILVRASPSGRDLEAAFVYAEARDLRLKSLVGNSEDCGRAARA